MSELKRRLFKVVTEGQGEARQRTEPLEEAREGIAQLLRQTRERYGQSLRDVSANLRIRLAYLQAIEEGRFRELPGATYAVGFVRSYAEYLGLDSADIVRRFKGEVEGLDSKIHLAFPEPVSEGKVPGGAIIIISLFVLAIGYGGWYAISSQTGEDAAVIPPVTGSLKELPAAAGSTASAPIAATPSPEPATAPTQGAARLPAAPVSAPAARATAPASAPVTPLPEPVSVPILPSAPAAESAPEPVAPALAQSDGGEVVIGGSEEEDESVIAPAVEFGPAAQTRAAEDGGLPAAPALPAAPSPEIADASAPSIPTQAAAAGPGRITLRARLASWIQISDPSGTPILTRTLSAGESIDVPDRPGLTLFTGNAGGLEILVDGRSISSLGPVGSVKRNIVLDPTALLGQGSPAQ